MINYIANLEKMEKIISKIVEREGINPCHKGCRYLKSAVKIVVCDYEKIDAVTKEIYTQIAEDYLTTPEAVERNIRFAINRTFCTGTNSERPTNKEYIGIIAGKTIDEISCTC